MGLLATLLTLRAPALHAAAVVAAVASGGAPVAVAAAYVRSCSFKHLQLLLLLLEGSRR